MKRHHLSLLVFMAVILAGCGSPPASSSAAAGAALAVNGRAVPRDIYQMLVDAQQYRLQSKGIHPDWTSQDGKRQLADIEASAIRALAHDALVEQLATERHLAVSDAEVDAAINRLEQALGGAGAYDTQLEQGGLTRDGFRMLFRYRLLEEKLQAADTRGYSALLARATASARIAAFVGPCSGDHQYPRCLGGG